MYVRTVDEVDWSPLNMMFYNFWFVLCVYQNKAFLQIYALID
jgi:hypothetical protein